MTSSKTNAKTATKPGKTSGKPGKTGKSPKKQGGPGKSQTKQGKIRKPPTKPSERESIAVLNDALASRILYHFGVQFGGHTGTTARKLNDIYLDLVSRVVAKIKSATSASGQKTVTAKIMMSVLDDPSITKETIDTHMAHHGSRKNKPIIDKKHLNPECNIIPDLLIKRAFYTFAPVSARIRAKAAAALNIHIVKQLGEIIEFAADLTKNGSKYKRVNPRTLEIAALIYSQSGKDQWNAFQKNFATLPKPSNEKDDWTDILNALSRSCSIYQGNHTEEIQNYIKTFANGVAHYAVEQARTMETTLQTAKPAIKRKILFSKDKKGETGDKYISYPAAKRALNIKDELLAVRSMANTCPSPSPKSGKNPVYSMCKIMDNNTFEKILYSHIPKGNQLRKSTEAIIQLYVEDAMKKVYNQAMIIAWLNKRKKINDTDLKYAMTGW